MKTKGFLLFEVLIAIVVISSVLFTITRSYASSKDAFKRASNMVRTAILLENAMFPFEESGESGGGEAGGEVPGAEAYSWTLEVVPSADTGAGLDMVTLNVFQEKDPETTKYGVVTYLSGAAEAAEETLDE